MEDLVLYAVDLAREMGAEYAEARYHKEKSFSISTRNGEPVDVGVELSEGIGVRVLVEGALGFSSTNTLTKEGVKEAVEAAVKLAKVSSGIVREKVEFADAPQGRARYEVVEKKPLENLGVEERLSFQVDLYEAVKSVTKEAALGVFVSSLSDSVEEKIVATSDGAFVKSRIPRVFFFSNIVLNHPQKGSLQRFIDLSGSGGVEVMESWNLLEEVPGETSRLEKVLLEGVEPPKEKVDVVVGSEVVALAAHESCGHPSEADRILGREAAQAGKSFIKPGMLGERIGSELVTIIDDPTIPGSAGFYLYDDEGVPARPRYLYKNGVINEFLHNRWTAKVFGVESNASARSMDFRSEPIIRMANTYLAPGDYSFEELLEDVKRGVYIKSYMEWNIDDERWSQRYVGLEAYEIVNGELGRPVRNPALEVTTKSFYSRIDAVGKEVRFYAGTCGKGEPAQGVPVWFGGPDVRLRGVVLGVVRK